MRKLPQEQPGAPLPGTKRLTWEGDLAARMVEGIRRYLVRETATAAGERERYWNRKLSSRAAYERSVQPNRERLARLLGVVDPRVPTDLRLVSNCPDPNFEANGDPFSEAAHQPLCLASADDYVVYEIRWSVLHGVEAEGLLLQPHEPARASVVALPDADQTPEMITGLQHGVPEAAQYARRLVESGCRVVIPALINRADTWSEVPGLPTNQPHREFLYRPAYELGRHVIGYEIQKVLAALDWLQQAKHPLGVIGYGEGGLIALYAAALDTRISAACVSGYFGPREELYREPIYRNLWSLLREFGDAEVATLIAPRALVVEASAAPAISGPPPVREGRSGAAPGAIVTPAPAAVRRELDRARALTGKLGEALTLIEPGGAGPGTEPALASLLGSLGLEPGAPGAPAELERLPDPEARLKRSFDALLEHTQYLMREAEFTRREYWKDADPTDVNTWQQTTRRYRTLMWEEVMGPLPEPELPPNPRTRKVYDTPAFTGYEVVLDLYPDVFSYGILLVPKDLPEGERRPVVVCQHGLEGRPQDVANPDTVEPYYKLFACRLAERGYVTFSPQNPYIGGDDFRVLQRLANPLKLSLFSFIIRQHEAILNWLKTLPYVDAHRMAFYGLSYGGKTAMRVPAILEDYCLSICSGDFDEWIWKNCSARHPYSYVRTGEYEMFEFNLGNTFNYAEMSYLICPRPFMVERGHWDGVAPDEWVAYEFAKTRYRYDLLGLQDRTELEFFNGPHEIHAEGTFAFLDKHLRGGG